MHLEGAEIGGIRHRHRDLVFHAQARNALRGQLNDFRAEVCTRSESPTSSDSTVRWTSRVK